MSGAEHTLSGFDDPGLSFADALIQHAQAAAPRLASLLEVASVPRKFDGPLLAAMTDDDVDSPDFGSAFTSLIEMPFVSLRRDGRFRLHNEIRNALLERFEISEAERSRFRSLSERVAAYYDEEHERGRALADSFGKVDELLREISPSRVPLMRSACEDRLIRPIIEAQYHRTFVASMDDILKSVQDIVQLYFRERRLGVCRVFLSSWRSDLRRLADRAEVRDGESALDGDESISSEDIATLIGWATYYDGLLALAEGNYVQARELAEQVLAESKFTGQLRLWSLLLVTDALTSAGLFPAALESIERELAERGTHDTDPWNRPLAYQREANVRSLLWDSEGAVASTARAVDAARSAGNVALQAETLTQMSATLAWRDDIAGAVDQALQALHIVRSCGPPIVEQAWGCAVQMMGSFGALDPRLADTLRSEARSLIRGDEAGRLAAVETSYVDVLVARGRFDAAHQVLDGLAGVTGELRLAEWSGLQIARANLLDAQGRERDAVTLNRQTVDEVRRRRGDPYDVASALTNAATTEMQLGDLLDEAETSAREAREVWGKMGHRPGVVLADVVQAQVHRRRGDYDLARACLATEMPASGIARTIWLRVAIDLEVDLGHLDVASNHLEALVSECSGPSERRPAASTLAEVLQISFRSGNQNAACSAADRLASVMTAYQALAAYEATAAQDLADQHNGRAIRLLSLESKRPEKDARDAVQHLEEASAHDAESWWFPLNLAYAYLWLGDKKAARKAVNVAANKVPPGPFAAPVRQLPGKFKD